MPRPICEITGSHDAPPPPPPSEKDQILLFLRQRQGWSADSGMAYTANDVSLARSPLYDARSEPPDGPLDGTLRWRFAVHHEPHDARLDRTRQLLDELTDEGKIHRATDEHGQPHYWARNE